MIPAPGEPGSETWKDKNNAWQTGGGAMWITGSYDAATNQVIWGTGNPVPMFDPTYRPGDNLYTNSMISWDPDSGKMNWYFQYTPGDMWDYDEAGTAHPDRRPGRRPAAQADHPFRAQRLPLHLGAQQRPDVLAKPYVENINWTKGIDQKTGKPVDYDPDKDIQVYSGMQNQTLADRTKKLCPSMSGGNNYWPAAYSQKTKLIYIPAMSSCNEVTLDPSLPTRPATGRAPRSRTSSATKPTSSSPIRSPARSRRRCTSPTRTTAARWRPPAGSSSPASPTAPSRL